VKIASGNTIPDAIFGVTIIRTTAEKCPQEDTEK
jgi:hypothetical protein